VRFGFRTGTPPKPGLNPEKVGFFFILRAAWSCDPSFCSKFSSKHEFYDIIWASMSTWAMVTCPWSFSATFSLKTEWYIKVLGLEWRKRPLWPFWYLIGPLDTLTCQLGPLWTACRVTHHSNCNSVQILKPPRKLGFTTSCSSCWHVNGQFGLRRSKCRETLHSNRNFS